MHANEHLATPPAVLNPAYKPTTIIDREQEQQELADALTTIGSRNLYLHGPRGTGKTLLTRTSLEALPDNTETCYLSCTRFDTHYQAIRRLYQLLAGDDKGSGHRTDQLQRAFEPLLADRDTVIVLDDINFLLANDGENLLYYLTRMKHSTNTTIICIGTRHPEIRGQIEPRALSTLQPRYVNIDEYTAPQVYRILEARLREGSLLDNVEREAITLIATRTRNIQLGLHWLEQAATTATESITKEIVRDVKPAATQRYREALLSGFTDHHYTLLEAISQLETETQALVATGPVYDRYEALCQNTGKAPLSYRRVYDFLTQLGLLDLIDIDHQQGGPNGTTRKIQVKQHL